MARSRSFQKEISSGPSCGHLFQMMSKLSYYRLRKIEDPKRISKIRNGIWRSMMNIWTSYWNMTSNRQKKEEDIHHFWFREKRTREILIHIELIKNLSRSWFQTINWVFSMLQVELWMSSYGTISLHLNKEQHTNVVFKVWVAINLKQTFWISPSIMWRASRALKVMAWKKLTITMNSQILIMGTRSKNEMKNKLTG